MGSSNGEKAPSGGIKKAPLAGVIQKLRKRRIIETLVAFIGGGWLIIEFVDRILVAHYHFPDRTIDITFVTLLCALVCTLLWRWFSGREEPRKFKLELVLIPLVLLVAILLDINLLLHLKGPESEPIPVSKWKNSVAVLPFDDMSPQKDQEYFCNGLTEELINRLSHIKDLKVPARTSAFFFKGKSDIKEIGRKLDVRTVLEGSIRKAGDQLRVTAQLINVGDGFHMWSETYDRELKDVFVIWDDIALAIADKLEITLLGNEKAALTKRPIDNVAAYEYYLRAAREIERFREDSLDRAIQYLRTGLDLMPDNALLYSAMAYAYWQCANIGVGQEEYSAKAEEYALKALALDPASARALAVLGLIETSFRGDQRAAIRYLKRALSISPNDSMTLGWLSDIYTEYVGKIRAAEPLIDKLIEIDPQNSQSFVFQSLAYTFNGRYELALGPLAKAYQIDPGNMSALLGYATALAYNKRIDDALPLVDQMVKVSPKSTFTRLALALKYGLLGDRVNLSSEMASEFLRTAKKDASWSRYLGTVLTLVGAKEEALNLLENAVDRGFINYPLLAERDPWLAGVRSEPRFKKLMERVKYEWEHFEE